MCSRACFDRRCVVYSFSIQTFCELRECPFSDIISYDTREQILGNVLTNATKTQGNNSTQVLSTNKQKSSSGVFLSKALVYYCFLVFRRIGECISLELFGGRVSEAEFGGRVSEAEFGEGCRTRRQNLEEGCRTRWQSLEAGGVGGRV